MKLSYSAIHVIKIKRNQHKLGRLLTQQAYHGRSHSINPLTPVFADFSYDGTGGEVYFWVGLGPQPSSKGVKVPDEYG